MQRATYSVQHATCSVQHATCIMQREACNVRHATCVMKRETCNVQHATCSMQCVTCNAHHAPCNGAQAGGRAECAPVEMLRMRQERLRRAAENIIRVRTFGVCTRVGVRGRSRATVATGKAAAPHVPRLSHAQFRAVQFAHVAWWQLWVARCASEIIPLQVARWMYDV